MVAQGRKGIPSFKAGDTLRVHVRVVEGESERIQIFEGVVIRRRGKGDSETFTVRKISFGVGVERVFPLNSPRIARIEMVRRGRARRAKLYFLRKLAGKGARLAEDKRGETLQSEYPEEKEAESSPAPDAVADEQPPAKAEAAPV